MNQNYEPVWQVGKWNEKDIEVLKFLYSKPVSNENITKVLNRKREAIWSEAKKLKLKKKFKINSAWSTTLTENINAKETDLAWAAGFIEGEGSVRFYHRLSYKVRKDGTYLAYNSAKISAHNTKREYLEFIKSLFGGYIYVSNKKGSKVGRYKMAGDYTTSHDVWAWVTCHRFAYLACKAILPYIHSENLTRAKDIIKWYKDYEWWNNIDNIKGSTEAILAETRNF